MYVADCDRGSPRTFKVCINMREIVDFSTYMEYIEYYSS